MTIQPIASDSGSGLPPVARPAHIRARELARTPITSENRKRLEEDWRETLDCLSKNKLARLDSIQPEFTHLLVERWFRLMGTVNAEREAEAELVHDMPRTLTLEQCKLSDCSFAALLEALRQNGDSEHAESAKEWSGEERRRLAPLFSVRLAQDTLSGRQMVELVRAVQAHGGIRELFLEGNHVGDATIAEVAKVLQEGHALHILNLGSNGVQDAGAGALAKLLETYPEGTLKKLHLRTNNIGDTGAEAFADALRSNSTLQELKLESNRIEEEGRAALSQVAQDHKVCTICVDGMPQRSEGGLQDPAQAEGVVRTGQLDRPEVSPRQHPGGDIETDSVRRLNFPLPSSTPPRK